MKPQNVILEIQRSLDEIEIKSQNFELGFIIKCQEMESSLAILKRELAVFKASQKAELDLIRAKIGYLSSQVI